MESKLPGYKLTSAEINNFMLNHAIHKIYLNTEKKSNQY